MLALEPDPYESDWVPKKNKGLVLHELHCSLGGTFNQTSASITSDNFIGVAVASNWLTTGHNSGARYCRIKTVAERGYKLVVDGNKVLVVYPSDARTDMPIGMERGIALRYMNRQHRKVLKSYSAIQAEATELLGTIYIE